MEGMAAAENALSPTTRRRGGKLALLRKAELFSALDEAELALLARYSEYREYQAGESIAAEGSLQQELSLIRSGSVVIRKSEEGGGSTDVARFLEGEAFGEMDLLDDAPRDAHAVAEVPTTLLIFPARGLAFREILEGHPVLSARILTKLLGVIAGKIRATDRLVSEKAPWIQELKRQLHRDKLTSLHNRAFLEEELAGLLTVSRYTSLLVVKPDNFKTINDTYGHDAGDRALVRLAAAVRGCLGDGELGVRYRGDEFCAVLPGAAIAEAAARAAALAAAVRAIDLSDIAEDPAFILTASIGNATCPLQAADAPSMIARAFQMMLQAREAGGNAVRGAQ
jgi:diguanylate cyclase